MNEKEMAIFSRDRVDKGLSKELDMEILEIKDGYCCGRMKLGKQHENPYGWAHGGALVSLADTVAGIAATTAGSYVSTLNCTMNFLKSAVNTKYVTCIGKKIKDGNNILVYNASLYNDAEELLAQGDFTYFSLHTPLPRD